jgi:integrase
VVAIRRQPEGGGCVRFLFRYLKAACSGQARTHEEEARTAQHSPAPRTQAISDLWLAKLQQSGFLQSGMPLWLSRKHVAKLFGLARETIWRIVRTAALRAGVNPKRVGCHSYRKSLAVKCWNLSGKNIMAVKEALGHKEVSSTQAYLDSILSDDTIDALFLAA